MNGQMSLWETAQPREPPPKPAKPARRVYTEPYGKIKSPQGEKDKKGVYVYEKIRQDVEKLPEHIQDIFHLLILVPFVHYRPLMALVNKFDRITQFDRDDYLESIGRLGG